MPIGKTSHRAYDGNSIVHLDDVDHVRRLPDMYIGDTGRRGLHHLINEIVNNSVDEVMDEDGHADTIWVTLHADNSISVRDNGRGIPPGINEKAGVSAIELAMTQLKAGGKFGGGGYTISGGLHGVGLSCVNFLSEWCVATVLRDGKTYLLRCERGIPVGDLVVMDSFPSRFGRGAEERGGVGSGTTIHWLADRSIFGEHDYDIGTIVDTIRYICYLSRKATVHLVDEHGRVEPLTMHFERGIEQFVDDLNEARGSVGEMVYLNKTRPDDAGRENYVEIAMQYSAASTECVLSFANHVQTKEGGVHVAGFRAALSRVINQHARKIGALKEGEDNFTGDDTREGLTALVSVRLQGPQFESNTKVKLNNAYMEKAVASVVTEGLGQFLEERPVAAKLIVDRVLASYRARLAAEKAMSLVKRQNSIDGAGLPGKLADCLERDPRRCELFLVEGDSAGGSAKGGRDRRTQAILPLRGKILNVDKAALGRILENNEVRSLIAALGAGIDLTNSRSTPSLPVSGGVARNEPGWVGKFDIARLRYHRIIIMTDADVDGSHIRTLLLTFFFRHMRPIVERGHVYMALPPLYSIKSGKNFKRYAAGRAELDQVVKELGRKDYQVGRFKGLGEMNPEELYETTMNPSTRRLAQVTMADAVAADAIFSVLMSDRVEPRKQFIIRYAKEVADVDWHC